MITTARVHMNPGKVAEPHNARADILKEKEKHINPAGIHEVWVRDQTLEQAYEKLFGEAIEEYNAKQTKPSRRLTVAKYIQSIEADSRGRRKKKVNNQGEVYTDSEDFNGKRTSIELIVSVGNTTTKERDKRGRIKYEQVIFDENAAHPLKRSGLHEVHTREVPYEVNELATKKYWETFEDRHPHFYIVRVDWHADEGYYNRHGVWEWGTPHSHGEIIGVGDGYKKGLSVQVSLSKALRAEGYKYYQDFLKAEQDYFEQLVRDAWADYVLDRPDLLKEKGFFLEFEHPVAGKTDVKNLDPETFRRVQALKDEVSHKLEELDGARDKLEKTRQEIEKTTQELEETREVLADTEQEVADAAETYRSKRRSIKEADQRIKDAGRHLADAELYEEAVRERMGAMDEEAGRLFDEMIERIRQLEEDYKEELEKLKKRAFEDGDESRREFNLTHTLKRKDGTTLTYEEAYQGWLRQQREPEESERKRAATEKRESIEEEAARALAKYRKERKGGQDYGET